MSHPPWALIPAYREVELPLAPIPRLLGATAEDSEGEISKSMQRYRGPARGPVKPSSAEVTGQLAAGTNMVVDVTKGGLTVIMPASARKRRANRRSSFGATCRLVPFPKAGLGATVGTPNQGYPLLQH
jgi:hypothetical protein